MIDYGIIRGAEEPQALEITSEMIFVASNVEPYEYGEDERHINRGYQYHYVSYTKNEYIKLLSEANDELKEELLDTQSALCDIYESLLGGE